MLLVQFNILSFPVLPPIFVLNLNKYVSKRKATKLRGVYVLQGN